MTPATAARTSHGTATGRPAPPTAASPFTTLLTNRLRAALVSHRARTRAKETA